MAMTKVTDLNWLQFALTMLVAFLITNVVMWVIMTGAPLLLKR
jgi:hypothetical protein